MGCPGPGFVVGATKPCGGHHRNDLKAAITKCLRRRHCTTQPNLVGDKESRQNDDKEEQPNFHIFPKRPKSNFEKSGIAAKVNPTEEHEYNKDIRDKFYKNFTKEEFLQVIKGVDGKYDENLAREMQDSIDRYDDDIE